MAPSPDPQLQKIADLVLRKRLQQHGERLTKCKKDVEKDATRHNLPSGRHLRELLVTAWCEAFETHCEQARRDLLGLMRTFDALSSAESFREKFDAHVDAAAAKLKQRLANTDFRGIPSAGSEQNRIANVASRIKTRSRQTLQEEVERAIREREAAEILMPSLGELDDRLPLNRRGSFDRDLAERVKAAQESDEPLSLVMIDLDHFKSVNDRHGHPVGDEVLLAAARLVGKRVARKGKAYRYGGEEFALLLPNYSAEETLGLAERIRKDIEMAAISSKKLNVTASFGVACLPDHASNPKALLQKADAALYRAKHEGRNCVRAEGE